MVQKMIRRLITFLFSIVLVSNISAQPFYKSTTGKLSFFAGTPIEDIDAVATSFVSIINIANGEVGFSVKNKDFKFKNGLMEEHFNENYMESEKYPKSDFKGKILQYEPINLDLNKKYQYEVLGKLTIHGVAVERTIKVDLTVQNKKIHLLTSFDVPVDDHKIERPKIVWEKIADKVKVSLESSYEKYEK
jgi:hypothetical protein